MKILFINLPYYGHVLPTIGLVQELIKRGCEVTYLLPFDWEETIRESGATFYGYQNHKQLSEQMNNAYATAESIIEKFDLVVYEHLFFTGKYLAEKHNKPVVRIFTGPVINETMKQEYTATGPLSLFKYKWIAKALTKAMAKNVTLKYDHWFDEIIYNPTELNLVYLLREYQSFEAELPKEQYIFIGPSIYERKEEKLDFVKGKNPLIYISVGTVVKGTMQFFQNCIDAFRDENVDVVISVGKDFDIKKLKNVPENIQIFNSVPQLEMLKIADVFVTHGGMNSISEAFVSGTPMVAIPFLYDQPRNAQFVEKLGVGKCLMLSDANTNSIKDSVFSVLSDDNIKKNIAKNQMLINQAPGNAGGAEIIINYYENFNYQILSA